MQGGHVLYGEEEKKDMDRTELFSLVERKYHTVPDYPWKDTNAVLRHSDTKKWYGVVLRVERAKIGLPGEGIAELLNIKCDPVLIGSLITQDGFFPAYHMNKENWISVLLSGESEEAFDRQIENLLDLSYSLTENKKKKTRF